MTDFGKLVKIALVNMDKTQAWLIEMVREKTGLYVDSSLMAKILTGKLSYNANSKITAAIKEILNI